MPDKHIPASRIRAVWLDPRLTTAQGAAVVGLSRSNLWRRAKALGLPARRKGRQQVIADKPLFREMWEAGVSIREMGRHFECHWITVCANARDGGLAMRRAGGRQVSLTVAAFFEARLGRAMQEIALAEGRALVASGMVDFGRGGFRPRRAA